MVRAAALSLFCSLVGCVWMDDVVSKNDFSNVRVLEVGADGEAEFCQGFSLSDAQIAFYFERAESVSFAQIHADFDYLPCFAKGILQYRKDHCEFIIRAGATAELVCAGNRQLFYGCKQCDELFQTAIQ